LQTGQSGKGLKVVLLGTGKSTKGNLLHTKQAKRQKDKEAVTLFRF